MRVTGVEDRILGYLNSRRKNTTSFADLNRDVLGFTSFTAGREAWIMYPGYENVVLWIYSSREAREAVVNLIRGGLVRVTPCRKDLYDRWIKIITLPVALPYTSYRSPRWLPVRIFLPKTLRM